MYDVLQLSILFIIRSKQNNVSMKRLFARVLMRAYAGHVRYYELPVRVSAGVC